MSVNGLLSAGKNMIEPIITTGAITSFMQTVPPTTIQNVALPIGLSQGLVHTALSKVFDVDHKPRLVQVAFPFVSGVVATALTATLLGSDAMPVYVCSSGIITAVMVAKMFFKKMIGAEHSVKQETYVPRVINYIIVNSATILPSIVAGQILHQKLNVTFQEVWGATGVLFGLAQLFASAVLGTREEGLITRFALPVMSIVLPMLIFSGLEGFTYPRSFEAFLTISTVALCVGLVGTIAATFFCRKAEPKAEVAQDKQEVRQPSFHRDGVGDVHKIGQTGNSNGKWVNQNGRWVQAK